MIRIVSSVTSILRKTSRNYFKFCAITNSWPCRLQLSRQITMSCQVVDASNARTILDEVDNFVFDCDGVLWDGLTAIDGSSDTVAKLKKLGKRVYYITNNSSSTRKNYVKKCAKLGFDAKEDEVLCTAYATALYLKNRKFTGRVYVVGNAAMGEELDAAGIDHFGIGPDVVGDRRAATEFKDVEMDPKVNCVLVGFDPDISYMKMVKGATYARREGSLFLATNEDPCLPLNCENTIPGTGCIVAGVKMAARMEPLIMGKPEPTVFEVLKEAHNLDPSRTIMVGDRCTTDIALAKNCGLQSLLVLSGCTSQQDVESFKVSEDPETVKNLPDYVADSLWQLGKHLPNSIKN